VNNISNILGYWFPPAIVDNIVKNNEKAVMGNGYFSFISMFIATERVCNLNCPFCYTAARKISPPFKVKLDNRRLDIIKSVIIQAKKHGLKSVVFAGEGEPLLSEYFWHLLDFINHQKLITVIFTNSTLISPTVANRLYHYNTSVIAKMNSLDAGIQDEMVGMKGTFEKMINGIENLINAGFRAPRYAIQSVITKKNIDTLYDLFLFCRDNNIVPYFETYVRSGRGARYSVIEEYDLPLNNIIHFFKEISYIDQKKYGVKWHLESNMRVIAYGSCNKNRTMLSLDYNGNLSRCVTSNQDYGNIFREGFNKIMHNKSIIQDLVKSSCKHCNSVKINDQLLHFGLKDKREYHKLGNVGQDIFSL
jgi:MoaA/NifB/PqqE/SkfB family radical SAM enzyme